MQIINTTNTTNVQDNPPQNINILVVLSILLLTFISFVSISSAQASNPFSQSTQQLSKSVVFVFDNSGSMAGGKLEHAKNASILALDKLSNADMTLVSFWNGCSVATYSNWSTNKSEIKSQIGNFQAIYSTPLSASLLYAYDLIETKKPHLSRNYIIMFTDGEETCSSKLPCDTIKGILNDSNRTGFPVYTIGYLVPSAAENELKCIANQTGGGYVNVNRTDDIEDALAKVFDDVEIRSTLPREVEQNYVPFSSSPDRGSRGRNETLNETSVIGLNKTNITTPINNTTTVVNVSNISRNGTINITINNSSLPLKINWFLYLMNKTDSIFFEAKKLRLIFVPIGYNLSNEQEFVETAKLSVERFLAVSPYKECTSPKSEMEFLILSLSSCNILSCDDQCGLDGSKSNCQQLALNCADLSKYKYDVVIGICHGLSCGGSCGGCAATIPGKSAVFNAVSCGGASPEKIMTHELGHALGLYHVKSTADTARGCWDNEGWACQGPNADDCNVSEEKKSAFVMTYCRNMEEYGPAGYAFLREKALGNGLVCKK